MDKKQVENSENTYKQDKLSKVPCWLKVVLLKYWVACAAFYFFGMGGYFVWYQEKDDYFDRTFKLIIFVGLGYTLLKEYVEKNFIRYMRTNQVDTYKYNLINLHGVVSFIAHFFYCMFLTFVMAIVSSAWIDNSNLLHTGLTGYGPFTIGLVYLILDIFFIVIKDLIIVLVKHLQYKKAIKIQNQILAEDDIPVYGAPSSKTENHDNFTNSEE